MRENNFLDLEKQEHNSTFGLISSIIAVFWIGLIFLPVFFGISSMLSSTTLMPIQLVGAAFAFISIRKNETRRILYLIGLIINGVGFLYFLLNALS